MGLRINTNIASINAQSNLRLVTRRVEQSIERLSSGLRINRAADDAAGLAISENFRALERSYTQAKRNASQGISLTQIADGALAETAEMLARMRALAVQSSNGTLGSTERTTADQEFSDLRDEIDRIAAVTEFSDFNPLISSSTVSIQVGANAGSNNTLTVSGVNATAAGIGISTVSVSTSALASSAIAILDTAISTVSTLRGSFGNTQNRLESAIRTLDTSIEGTSAAESAIRDTDIAAETAELSRNQVIQEASVAVLAQANLQTSIALKLLVFKV